MADEQEGILTLPDLPWPSPFECKCGGKQCLLLETDTRKE